MSQIYITKTEIELNITLPNQYHYGARESGSVIVDNGILRRKKLSDGRTEQEIAIFGLSMKGLLRELAYEICEYGLFPFQPGKNAFNPMNPSQADPNHPFYGLFGYADFHGKIRVSHGRLVNEARKHEDLIERRTSIRIDQSLHSASQGALFTYEVAEIQHIKYVIELVNATEEESLLLLATLNRLSGKSFTGKSSRGAGIIIDAQFKNKELEALKQKLTQKVQQLKKGGTHP